MFVNCLGNTFDPVVTLLHPMGITGEEFSDVCFVCKGHRSLY